MRIDPRSALADQQLQKNLSRTLSTTLHSRDAAVAEVENWEELRQYAHDVKAHTLANLADYLEELEENLTAAGGQIIWADTPQDAVQFILDLAHRHEIYKVVKGKSMTSEEIHLNTALEQAGIEPIETDLGEFIVQLAGEAPSHIIAPALHLSRGEISQLFTEKLGMAPTQDVEKITGLARRLLREHFLSAKIGITGVNFAVAENGTLVVVENEGNGRLSMSAPEIHIALMGIEKIVPRMLDLAVFLRLLIRSATGQKITSYVNLARGTRRPQEIDGPSQLFLILIDNGRSRILQDPLLRQTLSCIRCGACLNVCPVYQNIGGHAYQSTYQGPIGAILTPQLESVRTAPDHPFASSLCGACQVTCPVKIEIPRILLELRRQVQEDRNSRASSLPLEKWALQTWAHTMSSVDRFEKAARWGRRLQKPFSTASGLKIPGPPFKAWTKDRELPPLAPRSFRQIYLADRGSRRALEPGSRKSDVEGKQ